MLNCRGLSRLGGLREAGSVAPEGRQSGPVAGRQQLRLFSINSGLGCWLRRGRGLGSGLRLVRHRKGFKPIVLTAPGLKTTAGEPNGEQADGEQTQLLTTRAAHSKYRSRRSQQVVDVREGVGEQAQLLPRRETSTTFRSRSWQEVVHKHYAQLEMAAAGSRRRQQAAREGASSSGPGTEGEARPVEKKALRAEAETASNSSSSSPRETRHRSRSGDHGAAGRDRRRVESSRCRCCWHAASTSREGRVKEEMVSRG